MNTSGASFGSFGSSGNSSLAWSMGNGGKGRLLLEFPFPLNKGWYQEQPCTRFQALEHRKERKGFQHEFIVLKLVDGSVCRVERMGDPDARFNALSQQGSVAYDMIQSFQSENEAYLMTSDVIAEVTLPCIFDIVDVLKICRAIHEGGKTRQYTLRVLNCYFFSLAIQVCLTRLVAHWEDKALCGTWLAQVEEGVQALTGVSQPSMGPTPLHPGLVLSRLYYILIPWNNRSRPQTFAKRISEMYRYRRTRQTDVVLKRLVHCINNSLWHSSLNTNLDQFLGEEIRKIIFEIFQERVNMMKSATFSDSDGLVDVEYLKNLLLFILAEMLPPPTPNMDPGNPNGPIGDPPETQSVKQKPLDQPCPLVPPGTGKLDFKGMPKLNTISAIDLDLYQWIIQRFPYLMLWTLHAVLLMWGLTVFALPTDTIQCIYIDEKLDLLLTELESSDNITYSGLVQFMNEAHTLIGNQAAIWRRAPWVDICDCIKRGVLVDVPEEIEEQKPKVKFCSKEQAEPKLINISAFQGHVLSRIKAYSEGVELAWLGSAIELETELQNALSEVWRLIREDGNLLEKKAPSTIGASATITADPNAPETLSLAGNPARSPPARPSLKLSEPERAFKYSDIARRGLPPPSPTPPTASLPPLKSNDSPATSAATLKQPKPSTQPLITADNFPPLSPSPTRAPANKDKAAPTRKNWYAAATGTGTVKARPTVVTTGASATITAGPSVSESPASVLSPGARVISIQIGGTRPVTPPPAARPSLPPRSSKRRKRSSAPDNNTFYPPQLESRTRSDSTWSTTATIATSITPSSRGPASSKPLVCHTPVNEDVEWQSKLAELARMMSSSQRAGWEKILRCDPKDTSKMKWNAFDKALRALGFKAQARGGSETEYTPDPEYFGTKAQPISYHRPHPGADFTLGDLKAKSNSFRSQYPIAVAVLHDAWGLIDTRR